MPGCRGWEVYDSFTVTHLVHQVNLNFYVANIYPHSLVWMESWFKSQIGWVFKEKCTISFKTTRRFGEFALSYHFSPKEEEFELWSLLHTNCWLGVIGLPQLTLQNFQFRIHNIRAIIHFKHKVHTKSHIERSKISFKW